MEGRRGALPVVLLAALLVLAGALRFSTLDVQSSGDRFSVLRARSGRPRRVVPSMFDGMSIEGRAIEVLLQRAPRP